MRVRAERDGNAGAREALKQAAGGVVIVHGLTQSGGRYLDAPAGVACAGDHLVPQRGEVASGGEALVGKAHSEVRVSHDVEGEGALAGAAPCVRVATPDLIGAQVSPNVQVAAVVDPAVARGGRICAGNGSRPGLAGGKANVAHFSNPVDAAQAHDGAGAPAAYVFLAAGIPVAFKTVDNLKVGGDSSCEVARGFKGGAVRRQVCKRYLDLAGGIHAGGQGEVVGGNHDSTARGGSGADVLLKRGLAVREARVGVAVDDGPDGRRGVWGGDRGDGRMCWRHGSSSAGYAYGQLWHAWLVFARSPLLLDANLTPPFWMNNGRVIAGFPGPL